MMNITNPGLSPPKTVLFPCPGITAAAHQSGGGCFISGMVLGSSEDLESNGGFMKVNWAACKKTKEMAGHPPGSAGKFSATMAPARLLEASIPGLPID